MSLIKISPGTPEWDAWLKHHRGSKSELRMLSCQRQVQPWWASSRFPPETPRAECVQPTKLNGNGSHASWLVDRPAIAEGQIDEVADRLEARKLREDQETENDRRRRRRQNRADALREAALNACTENKRPDVSESDDLGTIEIEDPMEAAEMEHVGRGPAMLRRRKNVPKQLRVVSLKNDPVGRMHKRGQLGDDKDEVEMRLRAARLYEATYARAEIGGVKAFEFREPIDGGQFATPDTEGRIDAQKRLAEFDRALGIDGREIVHGVLVNHWGIATVAQAFRGVPKSATAATRNLTYYGFRFRECLDCIAKVAGLTPRPNSRRSPRDRFAGMDAPGIGNEALYVAIHRAKVAPG